MDEILYKIDVLVPKEKEVYTRRLFVTSHHDALRAVRRLRMESRIQRVFPLRKVPENKY